MVSRVQELDYERWLSTGEILDMATRGSAGVLGFGDEIGAIEPGRKADIVFLDLVHVNYVPLNDPVNQIVHGEDGTGVASVMIGGRMVLDERRMVTVDEAKLGPGCRGGGRAARRGQRRHEGDDGAARKRGRALWRGVVAGGLPHRTPRPLHDLDGFAETGFTLLSPIHSQFSGFCERAEWMFAQLFSLVNRIEHGIFHSQENPDFSGPFNLSGRYGP